MDFNFSALKEKRVWSAIAAEFGATLLFFLLVSFIGNEYYQIAIVYALLVGIYGKLSGAHMNPSLSFAKVLNDKMVWASFIGYFIAQVVAVAVVLVFFKSSGHHTFGTEDAQWENSMHFLSAVFASTVFVYFALAVGDEKRESSAPPALVLGFGYAFAHCLNQNMNPAVHVGQYLAGAVAGNFVPDQSLWMGPLSGLAGVFLAKTAYNLNN